ncbi:very short patch repair endonuclease [Algivirga pacifica]|uniref:very short patch repair endonuclease n=1 Tax=Algivirga pacifica TaxID=1162670 RepID=UPI0031E567BD
MAESREKKMRSKIMASIKSKNTRPELIVRRYLHTHGFRYNLHGKYKGKRLPGKPDIVLPKYNTVIFIHGCFWHGHQNCQYFKMPRTNTDFWRSKITRNRANDLDHKIDLLRKGWNVITIWECQIRYNKDLRQRVLKQLDHIIHNIKAIQSLSPDHPRELLQIV